MRLIGDDGRDAARLGGKRNMKTIRMMVGSMASLIGVGRRSNDKCQEGSAREELLGGLPIVVQPFITCSWWAWLATVWVTGYLYPVQTMTEGKL